jgi:flavin-binding protein dodecin
MQREFSMPDHVYKIEEIVGSSEDGIEEAIDGAIARANKTIRNLAWFEVSEIRGHIEDGEVAHYQVKLKVGFTLDDAKS